MIVDIEEIYEIFSKITDKYETPVPIGGRCESNHYYRTEELSEDDLNKCAYYVANRIKNVINPYYPELFLKLPGGYSFFAERLTAIYPEIDNRVTNVKLEEYTETKINNGFSETYKGRKAILVTDVITTARSSLEAHTKASLRGIPILCWATLIDRTLGPGPVSVVSSFTGAPVRVLTR